MGYLLTKQADVVPAETSLGIPYLKPTDNESVGNMLGGLVAGTGLAGAGAIGNSLFKNKLLKDKAFSDAVENNIDDVMQKLRKSNGKFSKWLLDHMYKAAPDKNFYTPSALHKGLKRVVGFKHLKLPGKLKALGLLAAPLAAGGLIDAAVD